METINKMYMILQNFYGANTNNYISFGDYQPINLVGLNESEMGFILYPDELSVYLKICEAIKTRLWLSQDFFIAEVEGDKGLIRVSNIKQIKIEEVFK